MSSWANLMNKGKRQKSVSWKDAYSIGFEIAINNKVFLLITFFAVLAERSTSLFLQYTGITMEQIIADYKGVFIAFADNPTGGYEILLPFKNIFIFMPVVVALFLLAAFILVGVLGLMRDLLIKKGYRPQDLFIRAGQFFWPVLKFKIPVYLIMSTLLILAALPALVHRQNKTMMIVYVVIGLLFYFMAFVAARIMLSLGPKMIVTKEIRKIIPVYRTVLQIIRPAIKQVIIFYLLMFGIIFVGLLIPFGVGRIEGNFILKNLFVILMMSFLTIFIKASSFSMYLQLVSMNICYYQNKSEEATWVN